MKLYEDIYCATGDDAWEDIEAIEDVGAERFVHDMLDMVYVPGEHPRLETAPWSEQEELHHVDGFVLSVDRGTPSVRITRIVGADGHQPEASLH
ncbi:MAG TPA: hypothetical protein ENK53_05995 [Thiotrichales bacterium]|nr:hypothetical protein [Thiotrichales bacterium]